MTLHFGKRFDKQTVELDGQDFEACTFVDCDLVYRGGDPPGLANNTFVTCRFRLDGAALRTIMFFREMYACGGGIWVDSWFALSRPQELPTLPGGLPQ
jgi:hypothetical protein